MKHFKLTLTRNRQIGALCWTAVLAAGLVASQFPVRDLLPLPLRMVIAAVLAAAAAAIIVTTLGLFTEKGDERAEENDRRANSALFTLLFLAMGALMLLSKTGQVFVLDRPTLLVLFAAVCLAKDLLFLGYERFAH